MRSDQYCNKNMLEYARILIVVWRTNCEAGVGVLEVISIAPKIC